MSNREVSCSVYTVRCIQVIYSQTCVALYTLMMQCIIKRKTLVDSHEGFSGPNVLKINCLKRVKYYSLTGI